MDPTFSVDSIEILPPKDSIVVLTTSRPTPRPEISETTSAVENPEAKINSLICLSDKLSAASFVIIPFEIAFDNTFSRFIPAPSSSISIKT